MNNYPGVLGRGTEEFNNESREKTFVNGDIKLSKKQKSRGKKMRRGVRSWGGGGKR